MPAWLVWASVAGFILGARLLTLRHASDLPYWDEWDAVLDRVLLPLQRGTLTLGDVVSLHVDHRVALTRLSVLFQYLADGRQWRLAPLYLFDAVLASVAYAGLLAALSRLFEDRAPFWFLALGVFTFAAPFDWQAQLWTFGSQEYFCLALSVAAFWLVANGSTRGTFWVGVLCGAAAFLSFAGGMFAALVVAGLAWVRWFASRGTVAPLGIVPAVIATLAVAPALLTSPHHTGVPGMGARSMGDFLHALGAVTAWPAWGFLAGITYLPFLVWAVRLALRRFRGNGAELFALGLGTWILLLGAAIAAGRAVSPTSSRYLALIAPGVPLNAAILWRLMAPAPVPPFARRNLVWAAASLLWAVVMVAGTVRQIGHEQITAQRRFDGLRAIQEQNVAAYLKSGDASVLLNQPPEHIPYPNGERLLSLLQQAEAAHVRIALPFAQDPARAGAWQREAGAAGAGLIALAVLLPLAACWRARLAHAPLTGKAGTPASEAGPAP